MKEPSNEEHADILSLIDENNCDSPKLITDRCSWDLNKKIRHKVTNFPLKLECKNKPSRSVFDNLNYASYQHVMLPSTY